MYRKTSWKIQNEIRLSKTQFSDCPDDFAYTPIILIKQTDYDNCNDRKSAPKK